MLVGKAFGPYVVDKELGSGAMGTVYRAKHKESGERVAVKLMSPALGTSEQARARFMRELEILKQLNHPNIVRYKGSGRYHGQPFFIMEYVKGDSLDRVMERRDRLTWEEIVEMGTQLCAALQHAHDKGIIHRDLKPSNIMVLQDGTVKLTDFGIAKDTDVTALTAANSTVGTAAYMSPEQCKGARDITHKSDLYSLGIVFYELLTGRKPFTAETPLEMFTKHAKEKFAPPSQWTPECPPWLNTLICQLMEKQPEGRPLNADTVAQSLAMVKEKVLTQQSAGAETAKKRRMDRAATDVPLDELDRDAARAILGKKKRKKKKAPLYTRGWFVSLAVALFLLLVGTSVYYIFIWVPSPESLYAQAEELMKSDPIAARKGPITVFLDNYRDHEKAHQVQVWADQVDRDRFEDQMLRLRSRETTPESKQEGYFRHALDSEEQGKLDLAKKWWREILRSKDNPEYANADQHKWDMVAAKYLKGLDEVPKNVQWLAGVMQAEKIAGKTIDDPKYTEQDKMALEATRLETAEKWSEALNAWTQLKVATKTEPEQRGWHLLAARKVRELTAKTAETKD
jgi:serine/threonine-protein kinase